MKVSAAPYRRPERRDFLLWRVRRAADEAPHRLSVKERTAVFAMTVRRWVRGRAACGSLILTSESNLCCAPLAAGAASRGETGRKKVNSWSDFLNTSRWPLLGEFANKIKTTSQMSRLDLLTFHIWIDSASCASVTALVFFSLFFFAFRRSLETEGHH